VRGVGKTGSLFLLTYFGENSAKNTQNTIGALGSVGLGG